MLHASPADPGGARTPLGELLPAHTTWHPPATLTELRCSLEGQRLSRHWPGRSGNDRGRAPGHCGLNARLPAARPHVIRERGHARRGRTAQTGGAGAAL